MKIDKKRVVAVFTGNRAEYGLQYPILKAINAHNELEYKLLVSGAHLDSNFGSTLQEIKSDGFDIYSEIKINMSGESAFSTSQAIGIGIVEISKVLNRLKPDLMLVYADRFEGFAAVVAATQMNIPTAHVEGGDLTQGGALDDSVRHAMTKLSHLHFTTNIQATNRILAMGEEPWRVHTVGFPAIDLVVDKKFATKEEVVKELDLNLDQPLIIFTQHSVSTQLEEVSHQFEESLKAIKILAKSNIQVILTYPNNDAGSKEIMNKIRFLSDQHISNIKVISSLGRYLYHGVLALAQDKKIRIACVGNSSSGIKETPAFGCPAINIGSRQNGRLRGANVLDVDYNSEEIIREVSKALFDDDFRISLESAFNPYGIGGAGVKIANILSTVPLDQKLLCKKMTLKGEKNQGWFR